MAIAPLILADFVTRIDHQTGAEDVVTQTPIRLESNSFGGFPNSTGSPNGTQVQTVRTDN